MNNAVFGKIMKNVRNHRDIKLVTTKARRNYSKSKPNNFFFRNFFSYRNEKKTTLTLISKPDYLGLSILELSQIVLYNFCYDYVIPKDGEKVKLCYMVTNSFILYIKTEDIYADASKRC